MTWTIRAGNHRPVRFLVAAAGYWGRGGPRCAWPVTVVLALVVGGSLLISYGLNLWNRHFFDALQAKDGAVALRQALLFPVLMGGYAAVCVAGMYGRMTLQRTWRAWCNDRILARWLARRRYFQLELADGDHRNPEFRIADDLRLATEQPVDFVTGFVTALLNAVTFVAVLAHVGGALALPVGSGTVTIPGFLVLAAIVYALLANGAMLAVGRRLIPTTAGKNQAEAEYRYRLTRVRENGEAIALLGGEAQERAGLDHSFAGVLRLWRDLCFQNMRIVIVSQGSAQLCGVVPVLLCAPKYLAGTMTLGELVQVASAFTIVQQALSWMVDNYSGIATWSASACRVASLLIGLDALDRSAPALGNGILDPARAQDLALALDGVSVELGDGTRLLRDVNLAVRARDRIHIVGQSGCGKSSLIRAVAGLWPWGRGEVACRQGATLFVLPQRPYLPLGSLRAAAAYPNRPEALGAGALEEAMRAVGLAHLVGRLDEDAAWDRILSAGEQQRLGFVRVLLQRPDIVILDEATSALDVEGQARVMRLLAERLPDAAVLSVAHRPELAAFHTRTILVQVQPDGARLVEGVAVIAGRRPARASGRTG